MLSHPATWARGFARALPTSRSYTESRPDSVTIVAPCVMRRRDVV